MRLYVAGRDISGDINSFAGINGGPATIDTPDITQEAMDRTAVHRDGGAQFVTYFNDTAGRAHAVFSALPTADVDAMGLLGVTLGSSAFALRAKQVDHSQTRGTDGALTFNVDLQANGYGLEWGEMLTAGRRVESAATNGTALDGAAATAHGLQAYAQCFALTSGSPTVKLQDSADNVSFADITGATFGVIAAQGTYRIATAAGSTVRRYVRAVTTGTFAGADFAVMLVRNLTLASF
jgi:hypothetical protein